MNNQRWEMRREKWKNNKHVKTLKTQTETWNTEQFLIINEEK